uniref:Uncharacterized protein n=1 Tax=Mus musculus TaxID=10090 RepID=Q8C4L9_MOUSE|nr:unnamed protein product [Mus musculus]
MESSGSLFPSFSSSRKSFFSSSKTKIPRTLGDSNSHWKLKNYLGSKFCSRRGSNLSGGSSTTVPWVTVGPMDATVFPRKSGNKLFLLPTTLHQEHGSKRCKDLESCLKV